MHYIFSPYFTWLVWFVLLPMSILWFFFWNLLIRYKIIYFKAVIAALIFSVPWDVVAYLTKVWEWPRDCCIGPRIAYLPLEEYGFLVFVTLYIVTVTLIFWNYFPRRTRK